MLLLSYFLTSFLCIKGDIAPGNIYDITWNKTNSEQINLELEVKKNDSWISHRKDDTNYLSVILDGHINKYDWDIPLELTTNWNSLNRIIVSDSETEEVILNRIFNFYGLSIQKIDNLLINDTLIIEWNTNIDNNLTINLVGNNEIYSLEKNYKGRDYELDLTGYPEGNYYIEIEYEFNLTSIDNIESSCDEFSDTCPRLASSSESNKFDIKYKFDDDDLDSKKKNKKLCFDNNICIGFFFFLVIIAGIIVIYGCIQFCKSN